MSPGPADPQGPAPETGQVIGHYRIDGVLGVGGMGMVFAATDQRLARRVALKVMLAHGASSPTFLARFEREATVLARLDSPHVVSIFDHGEQDGRPYLVTQYADGGDLGALLRDGGPLPPPLAFRVCAQVADALSAAHAVGVIHRDVKPANVLLRDRRTDRLHVYLCDFGVAHTDTSGSSGLTTAGAVAGTWNYLAPERAAGHAGGPASDVYAVGCLLFECLTGRPPYAGADVEVALAHLQQPVPQLPGDDALTTRVNVVLARCLAKDPAQRFDSATDLRNSLRALDGGATPAGPSAPPRVLGRRRTRRRAAAALAAVVLVVAGATGAALAVRGDDETPPAAAPAPSESGTPSDAPVSAPASPVEPVTGDLDGNGSGDFATRGDDGGWAFYSSSTPSAVGELSAPRPLPGAGFRALSGDVDGDGRLDLVDITGDPPVFSITVATAAGPTETAILQTPAIGDSLDSTAMVADFDGDGLDDVGVVTVDDGRLAVTVARSRADGLELGKIWLLTDAVTGILDEHDFALGDLTGDGLADLVHIIALDDQPVRLELLASTGRALEPVGRPGRLDPDVSAYVDWRAGDFDGDGTDELAYVDSGPTVDVWSWQDGRFTSERWIEESRDGFYVEQVSTTDVDGDGLDDLGVYAGDAGLRVLLSTGDTFVVAPGGGRIVASAKTGRGTIGPIETGP